MEYKEIKLNYVSNYDLGLAQLAINEAAKILNLGTIKAGFIKKDPKPEEILENGEVFETPDPITGYSKGFTSDKIWIREGQSPGGIVRTCFHECFHLWHFKNYPNTAFRSCPENLSEASEEAANIFERSGKRPGEPSIPPAALKQLQKAAFLEQLRREGRLQNAGPFL